MQIADQKAVTIAYTLKNDEGTIIDTSEGGTPLTYLHGADNIVPGLEKALEGKQPGDVVKVVVPAAEGYGLRDEKQIRKVPLRKLPEGKPRVGMRFRVQTPDGGAIAALVTAIQGDYATVDANHPLAGMTLHFDVTVVEVRDATPDELTHGHVHGPGGHH